MVDYAQWLQRAVDFCRDLRRLPGVARVEIKSAPPLSDRQIADIARSCHLPIPKPLREFWRTASGQCACTYQWEVAERFQSQLSVVSSRFSDTLWGGPQFDEPRDVVHLAGQWTDEFRDYPKDERFWKNSLPLIPVGNGDYAGLYLGDGSANPPVAYLCHEGCGGSGIIAESFDDFLMRWEQVGYLGLDLVCSFINPKTGLFEPGAFPVELEAVRALFRGEARPDLVKPPLVMTEDEWKSCGEPRLMLDWLESQGKLDEHRLRLFCCACCRRVWDQMGKWSRRAVEVAERYAETAEKTAHAELIRQVFGDRP